MTIKLEDISTRIWGSYDTIRATVRCEDGRLHAHVHYCDENLTMVQNHAAAKDGLLEKLRKHGY